MTRLIDADALMEALEKLELRSWNNRGMTRALQGARYINNESLLEAITNAPTVQREGWVSVEDRLPEYHRTVLVVRKNGDSCWVMTDSYQMNERFSDDNIEDGKVTHWQPLPAAPTDTE